MNNAGFIIFFSSKIKCHDIKVAILDSGINENKLIYKKYNTCTNTEKMEDKFNHGTKVFNVIHKSAPKKQHQLMPVKFPCHEAAQTAAPPLQRTFLWENIIKENSQPILLPKQNLHIIKIKKGENEMECS